jgi:hypothetical protein
MYEHFMPTVIIDKEIVYSNLKINQTIKFSSLIANMMRKNVFVTLPMRYCYTNVDTIPLKITDYNVN